MKKNIFYTLLMAATSPLWTSCAGDYTDWSNPQAYDTEATVAQYGVTFAPGSEANATSNDEDGMIQLVQLNASNKDVTGFTVKSVVVNGTKMDATITGNSVIVSAHELEQLVTKQFDSRAAVARQLDVVTDVALNLATGEAVSANLQGQTKGTFTPSTPRTIDPKGYYMLGDFKNVGWNPAAPHWMTSNGDGTFTATVTTNSTGDNWFKFYEGSHAGTTWDAVNQGMMGVLANGDKSLHGFVITPNDPWGEVQTAVISGQSTFEVILDMNNLTYSIKRAEAKYYAVGNIQGWKTDNMNAMFYTQGANQYTYTTKWQGAWDLKIWDANTFGNWDKAWGAKVDGANDMTGALYNEKGQAISAPTKGEYWTLTIDMNTQSYTWTKLYNQTPTTYNQVSLIGDFNGWGGDVDLSQLPDAPHNWHVKATLEKSGGLKFRANHDWGTSWGTADKETAIGDVYYLPIGNDNINVQAGTYDFYLNDITGLWTIVKAE